MGIDALSRRTFVRGATAVGGGVAMSGPLAALTAQTAQGAPAERAEGYGPLYRTPEKDTGIEYLALPKGFQYRLLNRSWDPSLAYTTAGGSPVERPTPTYFDGMGAFPGPNGSTILIRNHENRGDRANEQPVVVPPGFEYDSGSRAKGGLTRLVVGSDRKLAGPPVHVMGGTLTNCAGGEMPWGSWITCEETEQRTLSAGQRNQRHGYIFEMPAGVDGPVKAEPIRQAGFFSHEAVAWHDNVLYETEDVRERSCFYRYRPQQQITGVGQLLQSSGPLEALKIAGQPAFDADLMEVQKPYGVEWVPVPIADPAVGEPSTRDQAIGNGAAFFDRLEGCWEADGKIYFDATEGGLTNGQDYPNASGTPERELGQLFEYDPAAQTITLIFASPDPLVLQNPDNLVVVPATGHVFLQEDGDDQQYVRGVTTDGAIYDFAKTVVNDSEFCGGCFSAGGGTFFLNQQGGTANTPDGSENGLTYAIWGPFSRARGAGKGKPGAGRGSEPVTT